MVVVVVVVVVVGAPLDTTIVTVAPLGSDVPATGSVRMTLPDGTVGLVSCTVLTSKPSRPRSKGRLAARKINRVFRSRIRALQAVDQGVHQLVRRLRTDQHDELRVAVLAVDPTRRRSGGALLGDRIRMNALDGEHVCTAISTLVERGAAA